MHLKMTSKNGGHLLQSNVLTHFIRSVFKMQKRNTTTRRSHFVLLNVLLTVTHIGHWGPLPNQFPLFRYFPDFFLLLSKHWLPIAYHVHIYILRSVLYICAGLWIKIPNSNSDRFKDRACLNGNSQWTGHAMNRTFYPVPATDFGVDGDIQPLLCTVAPARLPRV